MRPLPWTIRVGLFAVGFGLGFSHYRPASTHRPIVLEIHLAVPNSKPSGQAIPTQILAESPRGAASPVRTPSVSF